MSSLHYDVAILGSGPAGEGAAMKLAKHGRRVAVIEAHRQVGGGCVHWGTIPSKTLRHGIQQLADFRRNPLFAKAMTQLHVEYPQLLQAAEAVIQDQVQTRYRYYRRNRIDLIFGHGRLSGPNEIEVVQGNGTIERLQADQIIIATGSRPYHPPDLDFSHPRILDSDQVLALDHTPASLTIYGAGVIGCEYASIFCSLDVKLNLIDSRDRLLSFLDDEISDALSYHLRQQGTLIRHQEEYAGVEPGDDGVVVHLKSGKKIKSEYLLWANGRSGNTQGLGLEALGIGVNHRGQVEVDKSFRTALPHIYAVGDVIGQPALASASYDQGRFVGALIAEGQSDWRLVEDFPVGIYTSPEISCLGRTERELTKDQVPYEVGRAMFRHIARAQITGHTVGILKLLFHRETLEILGIHCFGEGAAEIVHIGQAVMARGDGGNDVRYFAQTTFNYPTMAEAYREAALNGLNRLF